MKILQGCIVSFVQTSLKWQNEQNNRDVFSSCSIRSLKRGYYS